MVTVRYAVDLSQRDQHLVHVTMTVPAELAPGARLVVPTWTPGSYVERDYVHHLQALRATTSDGEQLVVRPDGRTTFVLPDGVDGPVEVELEWYAHELTVRTNHVDDHHALLVPPATFPYLEGAGDHPHEVEVTPTPGHRVHGLLPHREAELGTATTFVADDYLHLVDSAFEVGDFPVREFAVGDVPHRWVHASHGGTIDLDRIEQDVTAISEVARPLFDGSLPIESYTFLCVGTDAATGGGGLEHRDGSVLMLPVLTDTTDEGIRRTRSLIAHEYLHLWSVKRLVPAELLELTLDRPQHTTSLWVAEGWTAYYDDLLPARAGLTALRPYLDSLRDDHLWVERAPGARRQSLADSSWHAWTGLYVRDDNSVNAGTNYYTHGAVVAATLDLLLRDAAPDGDGLDEALRILWRRFGHDSPRGYPTTGYTADDVTAALSEAAGHDMGDIVLDHVLGTDPPPLVDLLDTVGLRVTTKQPDVVRPDLGVQTSDDDRGVTIDEVRRDRPAWHAGLSGGDRLVAVDGLVVGSGELPRVLSLHEPGDTVTVAVVRGPRLLHREVRLGDPLPERSFVPVEEPDDDQHRTFRRWTGQDLADL